MNQAIWEHFQNNRLDAFEASAPRLNFLVKQIAAHRKAEVRVLNVGIGSGYFEKQCLLRGWHTYAVDPDERSCARLRVAGIDAKAGLVEQLPFTDASLDFVVASEVLEHLSADQFSAGLLEIWRVLKPGGHFLGTVPHAENLGEQQAICPQCSHVFHRWGHQQSFKPQELWNRLSETFVVWDMGRTAFAQLRGRGLRGFIKGAARIVLGRMGEPAAAPSIWWIAQRPVR